jgi:sulfite exporter TauE/SafE
MLQLITSAAVMGMLGSFHCVGMCGPLALSLPLRSKSLWGKFAGSFIYNAGRVTTYSFWGLAFGAAGQTAAFFGYQRWLSITAGIVIFFAVVWPGIFKKLPRHNFITTFFTMLRNKLAALFSKKGNTSLYTIGLLNGLLPCGLVYMAATASVATGSIKLAVLFMIFFGLGTLPVMWSISFWGNYIGAGLRMHIRKAYPYVMMLVACLLIIRGLGLGIPYISPKMHADKNKALSCPAFTAEKKSNSN